MQERLSPKGLARLAEIHQIDGANRWKCFDITFERLNAICLIDPVAIDFAADIQVSADMPLRPRYVPQSQTKRSARPTGPVFWPLDADDF
jgi:hypothetical protein